MQLLNEVSTYEEPGDPSTVRIGTVAATAKIALIGHSHMGCLLAAQSDSNLSGDTTLDFVPLQLLQAALPYLIHLDGWWQYNPLVDDAVQDLLAREKPDLVLLMLEGQQMAGVGFVQPVRPFDFCLPGYQFERASDGDLVPYNMVLELAVERFHHIDAFVQRIRPMIRQHVVALSPPPPIEHNDLVLQLAQPNETLHELLCKAGVPPSLWRWKMWRLYVNAISGIFRRHGIVFLEPPDAAFGPGRFIDEKLISDSCHGNSAYGSLLMRQLEEFLNATKAATTP